MSAHPDISLRRALDDDIPRLRELYRHTILTVNARDYDDAQLAAWAGTADRIESLRERIANQHFLVAELAGEIVGFASLAPPDYLDLMYVSARHQRLGIGRRLGETMLAHAVAAGARRVEADVSLTARPLFEALGFEHVEDRYPVIDEVELRNALMAVELVPRVRPLRRAELSAVMTLDAGIFGGEGYGPYTWRQLFDLHAPFLFVADAPGGGPLQGFVAGGIGSDGLGWCLALGVAASARGQGVGKALTARLLRAFDARGVRATRLTVAPENTAALALYTALGFETLTLERDYYGPNKDRLILMRGP
jgi:putative acetyltransferase